MGRKTLCRILSVLCCLSVCAGMLSAPLHALAAPTSIIDQNIAANRAIAIESNEIPDWPEGPVVNAESAILMELETGTILYEKNVHAREYPASTTKILTTLLVTEHCSLDEIVTFSHDAVFDTPRNSNHVSLNVGDTLTAEKCLQAILIRSANEVSFGVAEHIGGTREAFVDMMNERAAELGCVDSHFANPNGLPDEEHYTSAYDLARIGRAFFANELLCKITLMPTLRLTNSNGELVDANKMELLPGKKYAYEYIIGCKTGYTDAARSCLVSCAEKDGMKLICVVLKDEAPYQYEDTISLYNYGFSNFEKVNVSQVETRYTIENSGFYSDNDIFGSSQPILQLNPDDCVILPKTTQFTALDSDLTYATEAAAQNSQQTKQVARINYSYRGIPLGTASVNLASNEKKGYTFVSIDEEEEAAKRKLPTVIFINVLKVLLWIVGIIAILFLLVSLIRAYRLYERRHPNTRRNWKRARRRQRNYAQSRNSTQLARRQQALKQEKRRRRRSRSRYGSDTKRNLHF